MKRNQQQPFAKNSNKWACIETSAFSAFFENARSMFFLSLAKKIGSDLPFAMRWNAGIVDLSAKLKVLIDRMKIVGISNNTYITAKKVCVKFTYRESASYVLHLWQMKKTEKEKEEEQITKQNVIVAFFRCGW